MKTKRVRNDSLYEDGARKLHSVSRNKLKNKGLRNINPSDVILCSEFDEDLQPHFEKLRRS